MPCFVFFLYQIVGCLCKNETQLVLKKLTPCCVNLNTSRLLFSYLGQQLRDVTISLVWLVVNPAEDRLIHRVLLAHVEVVALNNGGQLLNREIHKLLGDRHYLLKAVQDVVEDFFTLLRHVVDTHQLPDADAVPRGQLVLQEEPAALNQPRHQELVCSCQKLHHVILRHRSRVGVGIVDDEAHHLRRHPGDGVLLLFDGCPGSGKESAVGSGDQGFRKDNTYQSHNK